MINIDAIPVLSGGQHLQEGERRISTWKTDYFGEIKGHQFRIITEGSDGNSDKIQHIVEVIRYERDGGKVVFKDEPYGETSKRILELREIC